ncbi:glutamine--fructose-6-phosphate transaminase (isomerizing) [Sandarakinorhabdus cyanobacteriorum]|uniref:Glutamine--fructose-6-phosphate aminotransferase [isomerizing] n=1 Tax=Sandarakinorhabdus cyanobacteriorum TaxID=1981098 RepID=A0A255YB40_9SPHN|nr:glutamine--fructose-6-phosphate transaminase (isomerizing) [Sandarakinorhabdus cyanobacteriorum]OYQ26432.1 glutamine--fructose-6-phosphate transaminase (isomerizing) [Sandarakinorhabdus cyanobacteriorum]
MCGIIGILSGEPVADRLIDGLRRLEYRGYDSAGIATIHDGVIGRRRASGKLANLARELAADPLAGSIGIAHTRWATHGAPTTGNAHPHTTENVCLVHNGIIENFKPLRAEVIAAGRTLSSDTDTEVVAHLLELALAGGASPDAAVAGTLKRLHGAFSFAILFKSHPDVLYGARRGSPLVVGQGQGEMFLGSDALGLAPFTNRIAYLEEGDWVRLDRTGAAMFDADDQPVSRAFITSSASAAVMEKGNHRHYMEKEIHEQPIVVAQTLGAYLDPLAETVALPRELPFDLADVKRVQIVACGTALLAGHVASYWIESLARVPVAIENASEYRYRDPVYEPGGLCLFISQSGETADTLAALRHAAAGGQMVAAVVNVDTSTMARETQLLLPTHAGPEVGVASTKAFTCQLSVLAAFAIALGKAKGRVDAAEEARLVHLLTEVPAAMNVALRCEEAIAAMAPTLAKARDILYIGRGPDYPMALEGALKLKEISYIHAEGYAAGELKHGPIALIDEHVPVIVIAPSGPRFEKTVSNMQEVMARGGRVVLISDAEGIASHGQGSMAAITLPTVDPFITPLISAIPVQLLAYHVALAKGTDVDQPRNLAKSVTVE